MKIIARAGALADIGNCFVLFNLQFNYSSNIFVLIVYLVGYNIIIFQKALNKFQARYLFEDFSFVALVAMIGQFKHTNMPKSKSIQYCQQMIVIYRQLLFL